MKKLKLNELRNLEFGSVDKKAIETLKGGSGPYRTRERYWTTPECPDIEFD